MKRTVNDEKIIAALMCAGSIKGASALANVSPRTISDRMKTREFAAAYAQAKADLLRTTLSGISSRMTAALDVIETIMNDTDTPPAVRIQAARTLLNSAGKLSERLSAEDLTAFRLSADIWDIEERL